MLDKLVEVEKRYEQLESLLRDPQILNKQREYSKVAKERAELEEIVTCYREWRKVEQEIRENRELLNENDEAIRELAKEEVSVLRERKEAIESRIKILILPKDPNDSKNVILEIRAGTGGDEASIFAGDLFRMYQRFIEKQEGWTMTLLDHNEGTAGGYKEIVVQVEGEDVYGKLKFESGVHRVQRVPATESQGRVHTSAASVAAMPEADEVDVQINMNDIRVDTFNSSGAGGQSVNTTYSAVRMVHIPTGIVVSCQDERSQIKNREKALSVLRSRIYEMELAKHNAIIADARKTLVGSGDRSDKIRTYNYPQSRVTDHRIGYTVYNLPTVMDGEIGDFIEQLRIAENAEKMKDGLGL